VLKHLNIVNTTSTSIKWAQLCCRNSNTL